MCTYKKTPLEEGLAKSVRARTPQVPPVVVIIVMVVSAFISGRGNVAERIEATSGMFQTLEFTQAVVPVPAFPFLFKCAD
jgi:hypothetical protein